MRTVASKIEQIENNEGSQGAALYTPPSHALYDEEFYKEGANSYFRQGKVDSIAPFCGVCKTGVDHIFSPNLFSGKLTFGTVFPTLVNVQISVIDADGNVDSYTVLSDYAVTIDVVNVAIIKLSTAPENSCMFVGYLLGKK